MDYPRGVILRRRLGGLCGLWAWHWGIHLGNGSVVHFNGLRKKQREAKIRLESIAEFASGHKVYVHRRPRCQRHAVAICGEALRLHRLAARNGFDSAYDFAFRNCQDFCKKCYHAKFEIGSGEGDVPWNRQSA